MKKTIGRIYIRKVQDLPEHTYKMVRVCNMQDWGNMQMQIEDSRRHPRRNCFVAYAMHEGRVIGAGILTGSSRSREFQVYVKPYYRNIGLGTRIYKRLMEISPVKPHVFNQVSSKTEYFFKRLGHYSRFAYKPSRANTMKDRARKRLGLHA